MCELAFFEEIFIPVAVQEMLANRQGIVFDNTMEMVMGCVAHIITQITFIVSYLKSEAS